MPNSKSAQTDEMRLLVIDDDLVQRKIISKLGAQSGFAVTEASTFEEAEQTLKSRKFDAITLDLSLGSKSGALLLRTIIDSGNCVPVIVISGAEEHVTRMTVTIAQSLHLDAEFVAKPLNLTDLRSVLTRKRGSAVAARGNAQLSLELLGARPDPAQIKTNWL